MLVVTEQRRLGLRVVIGAVEHPAGSEQVHDRLVDVLVELRHRQLRHRSLRSGGAGTPVGCGPQVGQPVDLGGDPQLHDTVALHRVVGLGALPGVDQVADRTGALRRCGTADGDAFVHERCDRHRPTPALVVEAHTVGNPHVGEVDLVELCVAGHLAKGSGLDSWSVHVHQERSDAAVLGNLRVGACYQQPVARDVGQCGPDLLAVDHPFVAVALCPGGEGGNVRAGTGLGEQLAPDVLVREQRSQELLLFGGAVNLHRRSAHSVADRVGDTAHRPACSGDPALYLALEPGADTESALTLGEVDPCQAGVELCLEELLIGGG